MRAPGSSLMCIAGRIVIGATGSVELAPRQVESLLRFHAVSAMMAQLLGDAEAKAHHIAWSRDLARVVDQHRRHFPDRRAAA